jgi:hypothetical protein
MPPGEEPDFLFFFEEAFEPFFFFFRESLALIAN